MTGTDNYAGQVIQLHGAEAVGKGEVTKDLMPVDIRPGLSENKERRQVLEPAAFHS